MKIFNNENYDDFVNSRISGDTLISGNELIKKIQGGYSLASAASLTKNHLEAIYTYAYILFNQEKYENALKLFSFLIFFEQSDMRFYVGVGSCLQMLNKPDLAITYLGIANISDPTDPAPAVQLAECLLAMNKKEEAISLLNTIYLEFKSEKKYEVLIKKVKSIIDFYNFKSE